ncbi:aspartate aminotransferase [Nostoc sp.]|uniref:aspartate aminotransferase n=1 Tax=Nostoc sp. TaxID=1180 RepID=UPI002FF5510B
MFEIKLQETRVYREAKEEGRQEGIKLGIKQAREQIEQGREEVKRELIPRCLAYGISIEEVAKLFDLTIEQVEQIRLASEQ